MPAPRHRAFGIAGHAGAADLGPRRIDRARRRDADLARQRRTAIAVAAHPRQSFIDELFRNQVELRVILGGEARPVLRIAAAGPAGLARAFDIDGWTAVLHACRLARNEAVGHQVSFGASQTRLLRHLARSRSRRSGYFSSWYTTSTTRSVRKLRKSLRSSHHAARIRTAS